MDYRIINWLSVRVRVPGRYRSVAGANGPYICRLSAADCSHDQLLFFKVQAILRFCSR